MFSVAGYGYVIGEEGSVAGALLPNFYLLHNMNNKTVIQILPKDDGYLKTRIFEHKYLPEYAGMTLDDWMGLENKVLQCSLQYSFFDSLYQKLLYDHNADVVQELAHRLGQLLEVEGPILESSGDSPVFFKLEEKDLSLAFSNSIICRMKFAFAGHLEMVLRDDSPNDICVTLDGQTLFTLRTEKTATEEHLTIYDQLWDFEFDPNTIVPEAHPAVLRQ